MIPVKINWIKTIATYITGVPYALLKNFLPAYFVFSILENAVILIFCKRMASIGYVVHKTICQGPNFLINIKYLFLDYNRDHKKVADVFTKDFKELVVNSIAKYPVLYIHTNNFVYRNILLPLQADGVLTLETRSGYRVPQVIEKIQLMDWSSVVQCIWDKKARQRLFRMESIFKYCLKRVDTYV